MTIAALRPLAKHRATCGICGIKGRNERYGALGDLPLGTQGFERGGGGVTLGHDDGQRLLEITHWIR